MGVRTYVKNQINKATETVEIFWSLLNLLCLCGKSIYNQTAEIVSCFVSVC